MHVASLATALAARDHDVVVFTRRDDPDLPDTVEMAPGVRVAHITAGPTSYVPKDELLPFMPELGRGIARRLEGTDERPDVLHSHFWMSGVAARVALAELPGAPIPQVHTFHALGTVKRRYQGSLDTSPPERAELELRVGEQTAHIIATCSDEVRELESMGLPAARTSVVPCGVDLALFHPDGPREDTGATRRIVTVGRLVPRKGVDLVIQALEMLVRHGYQDLELHVVGGGVGADALDRDPDAVRLDDLARELGVADRVVLRGRLGRDEIPAVLRSARAVVCTPWYEPFGIVPLEAMACGVPVVAARVGGLADTVVDEVTGLQVAPRDPGEIVSALARLLDHPEQAAEMGRNGLDRVRHHYSWPVVAALTESVYQDVAAATASSMQVRPLPRLRRIEPAEISAHLRGVPAALRSVQDQAGTLQEWALELVRRLCLGNRLMTAGNGGSAAEAQHLSAELVGRYSGDRRAFAAMALSAESSAVTAIGNDYGFEEVFARQIEGHGRAGDVLLLLSTSGRSRNLIRAAEAARAIGMTTWALTGPAPNPLHGMCGSALAVDAPAPHVQEGHLMAIHALCRAFDAELRRMEGSPHRRILGEVGR